MSLGGLARSGPQQKTDADDNEERPMPSGYDARSGGPSSNSTTTERKRSGVRPIRPCKNARAGPQPYLERRKNKTYARLRRARDARSGPQSIQLHKNKTETSLMLSGNCARSGPQRQMAKFQKKKKRRPIGLEAG